MSQYGGRGDSVVVTDGCHQPTPPHQSLPLRAHYNTGDTSQPLLASCAGDCEVRLHDVASGAVLKVYTPHTSEGGGVAVGGMKDEED